MGNRDRGSRSWFKKICRTSSATLFICKTISRSTFLCIFIKLSKSTFQFLLPFPQTTMGLWLALLWIYSVMEGELTFQYYSLLSMRMIEPSLIYIFNFPQHRGTNESLLNGYLFLFSLYELCCSLLSFLRSSIKLFWKSSFAILMLISFIPQHSD